MSRSRFILRQSKMQARLFASLASRRVDAKEFSYHTESNELAIADLKEAARRGN